MTDVEVCNLALGRIGISTFIASLAETSKEGRCCRALFPIVRDRVLESFDWPFATSEADLQDIGDPPYGWEYRYGYPVDCIKPRYITIEGSKQPTVPIPYEKREDGNGMAIVCDIQPARLVYTKRIENIAIWTPTAGSAFAWLMAAELVLPLAADSKMAIAANNAFQQALNQAANMSARADRKQPRQEDSYITTRQ